MIRDINSSKDIVKRILSEIRPEHDFSESSNFIEEGWLDSFDIVLLVASLDAEFDVSIDGMDIIPENFSNVNKIVELLLKQRKK